MTAMPSSQDWRQDEYEDKESERMYSSDNFRMRLMKVLNCEKKFCHDWTKCPFAHPNEKATRRDPFAGAKLRYAGIACPDMRKDQRCPRGHYCPYAHNVFEYWLHPSRYRTARCREADRCTRNICFFAHNDSELRMDVERPYVSPDDLIAAQKLARMDATVQQQYQEASQGALRDNGKNKQNWHGLNQEDIGQTYEEASQRSSHLGHQSILAPAASSQRTDVMNAFSSILRDSANTGGHSLEADTPDALHSSLQSPEKLSERRSLRGRSSGGDVDPSTSQARENGNALSETAPHLSRGHLTRSGPSHQNLLNATAELEKSKMSNLLSGTTSSGTARTPLDVNLYSSTSTVPDRRLHRRPRTSSSSIHPYVNTQSNLSSQSTTYSLGTGHSSAYGPQSFAMPSRGASDVAQMQLEQAMSLPSDLAQRLQLSHAISLPNTVAQMQSALVREQQDQAAMRQLYSSSALQSLQYFNSGQDPYLVNNVAQMPNFNQALDPNQIQEYGHMQDFNRPPVQEMQHLPRLDLRYGGLGENQGELSQRLSGQSSSGQSSRYNQVSQLYPKSGSGILSRGSSILPVLTTREAEQYRHPPPRQRAGNGAQWDPSLEHQDLDFSILNLNAGHPGPFP